MKKLSLLTLAAAGMLFGACSSDNDVAENNKLNQYDMVEGQTAWISVGIALPGEPVTRANEDLNDGIAEEYAVKNGKIVLFKGANEADAVLLKDYDITTTFSGEEGDQVPLGNTEGTAASGFGEVTSTSQKVVQEIEAPNLGGEDKLYAYVILNAANNVTNIAYTPGTKFSAFKDQVLTAIGIANEAKGYGAINTDKGLVMTSVPIASAPGGETAPAAGTKVTTLAEVDPTAVYTTKAAAEAGSSIACIYVERAAVKVEVKSSVTKVELESGNINCSISGWALGNTNNSNSGYYNTRKFDEAWMPYINAKCATDYLKYRMVGRTNFFASGHTTAYRTYFGSDVNYDGNTGLNNKAIAADDYTLALNGVTYTYENTFDENSQIYKNTTYVGFKVTLEGGDFYTMEGQLNTRLADEAAINAAISSNYSATITAAVTAIENAIAADLASATPTITGLSATPSITFKLTPAVTLGTYDSTTGEQPYTFKLAISDLKDGTTDFTAAQINAVKALADVQTALRDGTGVTPYSGTVKLYKYVGGVAYYAARIAHFGDVETPWGAPNEAYNDYAKIYPLNGQSIDATPIVYGSDRANAWLGRWGVVRNNWYRMTVEKIEGLGSPVPEDFSGDVTPDDNPSPKYYIAAHVHILPWAVRKQSVNLK